MFMIVQKQVNQVGRRYKKKEKCSPLLRPDGTFFWEFSIWTHLCVCVSLVLVSTSFFPVIPRTSSHCSFVRAEALSGLLAPPLA